MTDTQNEPDQGENIPVEDAIEEAQRRLADAEAANARVEALTKRLST